jgi:hypothetical protein
LVAQQVLRPRENNARLFKRIRQRLVHPPVREAIQRELDVELGALVGAESVVEPEADAVLVDLVDAAFEPGAVGDAGVPSVCSGLF